MSSKEKVMKILEGLSLDELREVQSYIDDLILRLEESGTKLQEKISSMVDTMPGLLRQNRFYVIFHCKFKKTSEMGNHPLSGIVVDISKGGLRLKTGKKLQIGDFLVIFPLETQEGSILAISSDYDSVHKKIFAEVIRVKESMGLYEIGCRFIPHYIPFFNSIV